jgi:hypothetical protein
VSQNLNNLLIILPNPDLHPEDIQVIDLAPPMEAFTHMVTVVSV